MSHTRTPDATGSETSARRASINDGDLSTPMPLNEFLSELGVVMQLPRSRTTAAQLVSEAKAAAEAEAASSRLAARGSRRGRRLLLPVLAALLASAVALVRFTSSPVQREIPPTLLGEWKTSHAKYRDRRLSFSANRVGIRFREGAMPAFHRVLSVETAGQGDSVSYLIGYQEDETPVRFRVSYRSTPRPAVILSNPADVVWERVDTSADGRALPR